MFIFRKVLIYILLVFLISSCNSSTIDPDTKKSRQEVKNLLIHGKDSDDDIPSLAFTNKSTPPNISRLLVTPPPPPMGNGELMSFSVTEEVPIKDVLVELGRLADIDIEIDPNISGGIILKVTNKQLDVVVQRIADLAGLKYSYKNNILKFEKDLPYTKTYHVDFLIENEIWGAVETSLNDLIGLIKLPEGEAEPKIIINKPASMITIYANNKTHSVVSNYIELVKASYGSQVLIEAKVVEVALNDKFQMGIDWNFVDNGHGRLSIGSIEELPGGINGNLTTAIFGGSLTAAVSALNQFGLTKTLSSPRVHAMNNQKADLKFINKLIYFSLEKEEDEDEDNNNTKTTYTATKQEEEVGVTLSITPSINIKKNEITLNVIPELKIKIGDVVDPTNELNKVPVIQSRSVETSLKIKSGNVLVIGGLMSEESANEESGVPFLSGIPVVGYFFKSVNRTKTMTETIIFIKATIIKPSGEINSYDKKILRFSNTKDDNFIGD